MIIHHSTCNSNYPEKLESESPQFIQYEQIDEKYWTKTCVDCGAFETNLPPDNDPYWDDIKEMKQ